LKRDGTEIFRLIRALFLGEEDNVGLVDGPQVGSEVVKPR
jgi:hypothetical protein